jgi:hypothetical protein
MMELKEELKRQRVKHIISSYHLAGNDGDPFDAVLAMLLDEYPTPLVELAIAETLVMNWLSVPMPKGCAFLTQVQEHLTLSDHPPECGDRSRPHIHSSITPAQFQHITGLDPSPIFGFPSP